MDKTTHQNCSCILIAFSAYMTKLTAKLSALLERTLNLGL
jgi:hypothetical protein